jgi:transcriptional regulator with GAF, ATPase, and Fis domain
LQNVIERAVILARGGVLEFDLPTRDVPLAAQSQTRHAAGQEMEFLTDAEIRQRERENVLAVFEKSQWKVSGANGAAELLGIKTTTLLSRMKAMGLKRPTTR